MASSILSHHSTLLPNTAAVIGVFPTLVGVAALLYPRTAYDKVFEFQKPTTTAEQKLADNMIRLYGARDIYLGVSVVGAWYSGDRRALGLLMLLGSGVVIVDGFVQKAQTGKGVEKHWPFVPVMVGLGGALLGWFDGMFTH